MEGEEDLVSPSIETEVFSMSSRPDLLQQTFSALNNFRKSGQFCDITICIGGKLIKAHRLVLAATTPYFSAMFSAEMADSKAEVVELHGLDPEAMEELVDFLYGERLLLTVENVQHLLSVAAFLQVFSVKDACVSFLMKKLHPENCITVRSLADTFSCFELLDAANSFMDKNFVEVSSSEEFNELSINELLDLISRDDLNVRSEEQVFEAVLGWVKEQVDERKKFLPKLLEQVRLPLLSPHYLSDRVLSEEIIHSNIHCRDLIDEAKDYMLMPERRKQLKSSRTCPRRCSEAAGLIYVLGGLALSGDSLSTVEKFDTITGQWVSVVPMSSQRSRVGVAILNGHLYAIGGFDGNVRLNDVEKYDPVENRWTRVCPMNVRRSAVGAAVLGGKIFVIGGYDGNSSLNSVECYDPELNQWRFVASMATLRSAAGVSALNGKIYSTGGHDGTTIFSSVEAYDTTLRQWRMVMPMTVRRCRHGLTVLNSRLYACGGYDGCCFLSSVEFYDPCSNQWTFVASMTQRRSRVATVALGGKLFAIGGYNGVINLNSVEFYDPWANSWEHLTSMSMHDGGVGAGVLPRV